MAFFGTNFSNPFSSVKSDYSSSYTNHIFIYDSQTSKTVKDNQYSTLQYDYNSQKQNDLLSVSRLNLNNFVKEKVNSLNLNVTTSTSAQQLYTVPIDFTDAGDLSGAFLKVINKYANSTEKTAYLTHQYYKEKKDGKNGEEEMHQVYTMTKVVPSLFNPYYGVKSRGSHSNLPLLDFDRSTLGEDLTGEFSDSSYIVYKAIGNQSTRPDTSNCSIWRLLQISALSRGNYRQGSSIYRLPDFMFCKDLGKVSNNHLITLRRYSNPVGDNIYHISNTGNPDNLFSITPDIGRMITWFGTEDNKLSDILKMSFHATWKEMNAEIQQVNSQADSEGTGIFGMFANSLDAGYNSSVNSGIAGNHSVIAQMMGGLGSRMGFSRVNFGAAGQYQNHEALGNYDTHKIYEPKNTIRSNNYYEGKIEFTNEFTLNFSYKMRAYDSLNQKAAMHDLIANILRVTFTKGTFWGGAVKMIGPHGNNSAIKKYDAFVDNTFDKLAGFVDNVINGSVSWQDIMGSISQGATQMFNAIKDGASNPSETLKEAASTLKDFFVNNKIGDAIKGQLKNALGRPALYAINSFVSGENLGLWHVTIGNPLNPIAVMGNMIITNTEMYFGDTPLGLDDFPTELKVAVTLKHCKPRDATDIQQMFTKGEGAIALPLSQGGWTHYFKNETGNVSSKDKYSEGALQQIFGTSVNHNIERNFREISQG